MRRKADEQIRSNGRLLRPPHIVCHKMFYNLPSCSSSSSLLRWPVYPTATFHCSDSHWMENSWFGDCPEHIMPNSSMNSHLPLPFSLLCPAFSLAACPHLRCGRAAETKEKQYLWEHASHPHMVLAASPLFPGFVSQSYSPEELLRFCFFSAFDKLKTGRFNAAPFAGRNGQKR